MKFSERKQAMEYIEDWEMNKREYWWITYVKPRQWRAKVQAQSKISSPWLTMAESCKLRWDTISLYVIFLTDELLLWDFYRGLGWHVVMPRVMGCVIKDWHACMHRAQRASVHVVANIYCHLQCKLVQSFTKTTVLCMQRRGEGREERREKREDKKLHWSPSIWLEFSEGKSSKAHTFKCRWGNFWGR